MAAKTLYAKGEMFKLPDEFLVVNLIFFSKSNAGIMNFACGYLLLGTSAQVSDVAHGPLVLLAHLSFSHLNLLLLSL